MSITRRDFLVRVGASAGAVALLPACGPATEPPPDVDPEPTGPGPEPDEPWSPDGEVVDSRFPFGLQTGDATVDSAIVSVHTTAAGAIGLVLARGVEGGWEEERRLNDLTAEDGVVQVDLNGLRADTTYSVVAYDGGSRSPVSRFRTAIAVGESRKIRFGATSCLGGNAPWRTLSEAAEEKFDFFIMGGDTVYVDQYANDAIRGVWEGAMRTPGLKDLTASTSLLATWDDHEVDNNWSWNAAGITERVQVGLGEFRRHLPVGPGGGEIGIWRKLSWGDAADVFVLDARGERRNGNYLSPEQLTWLKDGLSASTARFKIVVNPVPITDLADVVGELQQEDRWQGYPVQRGELLQHIADEEVAGVLFISGDFHIGALGKVDAPGGPAEDVWEVLAGPGGSPINPVVNFGVEFDAERFPIIVPGHNYVLFEADPESGEILVQFIDDNGLMIDERTLTV